MQLIILYILLIILLILSFFFSGVENVYVTVNKLRLQKDIKDGKKNAKKVHTMASKFNNTLSTLLLGNALVNPAATSIVAIIALRYAGTYGWNEGITTTLAAVFTFVFLLVFCEIIPKTLCLKFNYRLSYLFLYPMLFFKYLFLPVNFIMDKFLIFFGKVLARIFAKDKEENSYYNEEELTEMVNEIEEKGVIDEKTSSIIKSAIEFNETEAYEIMTPRVDVFAIDIDEDINEIISDKNSEIFKYSRVPVYEDTIDNIIGILPTKLLLKLILSKKKIKLKSLINEPFFVFRSKQISTLMKDFKESKQHIAIVKDEYGGTEGIITLEDIVEEIIGEIWDESDEVNEPVITLGEGHYLVDGGYNIEDFFQLLDVEEDEETDYDTVGGWCVDKLDHFGTVGESFIYENYQISVVEAEQYIIEKVEVKRIEEEDE